MKNKKILFVLITLLCVSCINSEGPWYSRWTANVSSGASRSWSATRGYSTSTFFYCYARSRSGGSYLADLGGPYLSYLNPSSYLSATHFLDRLKSRFFPNDKNQDLVEEMKKAGRHRESNVQQILREGADVNYEDRPPIVVSAEERSLSLARMINSHGLRDIDQRHPGSELTALMVAAQNGDERMVRYFLHEGASKELQDAAGRTSLSHSVENGFLPGIGLLATRANVNRGDIRQRTPLFKAAERKRRDMVKALWELGLGVDPNITDVLDRSPLVCAAYEKDKSMAKLLYDKGAAVGEKERSALCEQGWSQDLERWQEDDTVSEVASSDNGDESDDEKDSRGWFARLLFPIPPGPLLPRSSSRLSLGSQDGEDECDAPDEEVMEEIVTNGVRRSRSPRPYGQLMGPVQRRVRLLTNVGE